MTGVGLLYYEVWRVATTYCDIVMQVRFAARTYLLSQVHVSSFVVLYGSRNLKKESYVTFAEKNGSTVTVNIFKG